MDAQEIFKKVADEKKATEEKANEQAQQEQPKETTTPEKEVETKEEPKQLSPEELLKKREAEMTRGAQKLIEEKKQEAEKATKAEKEAQLYRDIVKEGKLIATDESKLVDLFYSKPEVAKGILDEYYGGMSFDEFVKSKELQDNTPAKIEALAEQKANQLFLRKELESQKTSFKKEMGYNEETEKKFDEQYNFVVGGRDVSLDDINKFLISAHKLAIIDGEDYKQVKKQEESAKRMAIGEGSSAGKEVKGLDPKVSQLIQNRKNS